MQLRRGLIAFALVFAALALALAIAAPPEDETTPATPGPRSGTPADATVAFRHPVEGEAPVRAVRRGAHAIVRVQAQVPGEVEFVGLGLLQPVTPGTPAVFDLLAARTGRFEVRLLSVAGERTRLGFLEVNE